MSENNLQSVIQRTHRGVCFPAKTFLILARASCVRFFLFGYEFSGNGNVKGNIQTSCVPEIFPVLERGSCHVAKYQHVYFIPKMIATTYFAYQVAFDCCLESFLSLGVIGIEGKVVDCKKNGDRVRSSRKDRTRV